jgi:hypothetical protein
VREPDGAAFDIQCEGPEHEFEVLRQQVGRQFGRNGDVQVRDREQPDHRRFLVQPGRDDEDSGRLETDDVHPALVCHVVLVEIGQGLLDLRAEFPD